MHAEKNQRLSFHVYKTFCQAFSTLSVILEYIIHLEAKGSIYILKTVTS